MARKRSTTESLICRIDVSAFAAVLLALLFLLMTPTWPDLPSNGADLPKVKHPILMRGANREDALVFVVQRDGQLWLGYQRLPLDSVPSKIREALSHGSEKKVYIRADARAKYGMVLQLLDRVRSAGVENVAFLVYERKTFRQVASRRDVGLVHVTSPFHSDSPGRGF